jgi:hypothetical protein
MSSNRILTMALAGLVGALSLPSVAYAQSVTPERALLNRTAGASWATTTTLTRPAVIDGERALLNRFPTITQTRSDRTTRSSPSRRPLTA